MFEKCGFEPILKQHLKTILNKLNSLMAVAKAITGEILMTDRTQFEQMLDMLINEDVQGAKEMFHNIVVAKSRDIYESLLDDDMEEGLEMEAIGGDATDSMIDDLESEDEFDPSEEGEEGED